MNIPDSPDTVCHADGRDEIRSLAGLLRYVPRAAARVLDCTGSLGGRGHLLKEHGAREVVGLVDGSAGAAGPDEGYDALHTGALDFMSLPEPEPAFDCIICTSALERLRNPEAFLPRLLECLAPGGLFLATVPNMQYHKIVCALAEGRWTYGGDGVWDPANLRFYTARELRTLLQGAGLDACRLASLVKDDEAAFPRGEDGIARSGRLRIGPLDDGAYQAWLTEYYLVLAVKPERAG